MLGEIAGEVTSWIAAAQARNSRNCGMDGLDVSTFIMLSYPGAEQGSNRPVSVAYSFLRELL